jgi:hypothetical protein
MKKDGACKPPTALRAQAAIMSVILLSTVSPALSHPGDHSALSPEETAAHLSSDPFHVGALLVVVGMIAAAMIWRRLRKNRHDRR